MSAPSKTDPKTDTKTDNKTLEDVLAELADARRRVAEAERLKAAGDRRTAKAERQRAAAEQQVAAQAASLQYATEQVAAEHDRTACVVCQDLPRCTILLPCRHVCLCEECSLLPGLRTCPLCREAITSVLPVFL